MIAGTIILEDFTISFSEGEEGTVTFTVTDAHAGKTETKNVSAPKFFKALAIAVHMDGMPDYRDDYLDAESIMGDIRWIP